MPADVSFLITGGALRGPLFEQLAGADQHELAHLQPGSILGAFRLLQRIGSGGSGIVFKAERHEGFEQTVAIKVVRTQERLRERFRLERSFLGRLEHPGIVRIIDGGETEGVLWSAMEFVEGMAIDAYCANQNPDWRTRLSMAAWVCDAIQFSHLHLVVHGDIKPSNILVDGSGVPRLLDFGISARYVDDDGAEPGYAFTPGFASPEQTTGARLTLASDIYQLGCLLRALFPASLAMPRLARINLDALVQRAIAVQPADRIESVAQMRNDLQLIASGRPCRSHPWSLWQRARFFARRSWRPLSALVLVGIAAVATMIFYTANIRTERDRAEIEARSARVTSDFLRNMFRVAAPIEGHQSTIVEVLDQSARRLMSVVAATPLDRAVLVETLASANLDRERYEQAATVLDHHAESVLLDASLPPALQARLLTLKARTDVHRAHPSRAAELATRAQSYLPRLRTEDADAVRIGLARVRAELARSSSRLPDAQHELEAVLKHYRGAANIEIAGAYGDLASIYAILGKREETLDAGRRSATMLAQLIGPDAPATMHMQRRYAFHLAVFGDKDEAERLLTQQESLVRSSFGENSMELADLFDKRGVLAFKRDDYPHAVDYFQQALAIQQHVGMGETTSSASTRHNLAGSMALTGRVEESIALLREALRLRTRSMSGREQVVLMNQFDLSLALCMHGDWTESQQLFEDTMRVYDDAIGKDTPVNAEVARERAECLVKGGQKAAAKILLEREITAPRWAKLSASRRAGLADLISSLGGTPLPDPVGTAPK